MISSLNKQRPSPPQKQQGYATLFMTLILLLVITLIAIYTAYSMTSQQRILTNHYNQLQAMQAAQGGLNYAVGYFTANSGAITTNGLGQWNLSSSFTGIPQNQAGQSLNFKFQFQQLSVSPSIIHVTSVGQSPDGSVSYTVSSNITNPRGYQAPNAPISAQGYFQNQGGIATITNNYTSNLGNTGLGLWNNNAGGRTHPVTNTVSNQQGASITTNSTLASLSNEAYFESIFHETEAEMYAESTPLDTETTAPSLYNLNPRNVTPAPQLLWLGPAPGDNSTDDVYVTNNLVIGTPAAPITLIVNNAVIHFSANSSLTINGLLYAGIANIWLVSTGNFNLTVNGAYASTNSITVVQQETLNATYDPTILSNLPGFNRYASIPGSWKDF